MKLFLIFLLVLFGCGDGSGGDDEEIPAVVLNEIPTARGLAALHCNQPEAANCVQIVSVLHDSLISKPAISYLVDGSFGFNSNRILSDIDSLTQDGRQLSVFFYLLNGPSQRRCPNNRGWGNDICAPEFMRQMKGNGAYRQAFKDQVVARMVPIVQFAQKRGAVVTMIPQLEDNIDDQTFAILTQLTSEVLPTVRIVRNGSGHSAVDYEIHPCTAGEIWNYNGVVVNDGCSFDCPGENTSYPRKTSLDELRVMRDKSAAMNISFLLWKADVQGVYSWASPEPAARQYRTLSQIDIDLLKNFLLGQ